jgi:hypothetical protein
MAAGALAFAAGYDWLVGARAAGLDRTELGLWLILLVALCLPACALGVFLLVEGVPDRNE